MTRRTCGDCQHLVSRDMMGCPVYSCGKTDFIVPQNGSPDRTTFHRIPQECPLPSDEVSKSWTAVAKKYWVTIEHPKLSGKKGS